MLYRRHTEHGQAWRLAPWHTLRSRAASHRSKGAFLLQESSVWRRGRDSNPRSRLRGTTVFKTVAFVHSATPPRCAARPSGALPTPRPKTLQPAWRQTANVAKRMAKVKVP